MTTGSATRDAAVQDLVLANRILAAHGVVDAFGHVSVRCPDRPDHFLLARNLAPATVENQDILVFDSAGEPIQASAEPIYLERFIHSAILAERPDVIAVVHSHSQAVIPFGLVADVPFEAVFHMSAFLGPKIPKFEIRDTVTGSDLLIRTPELGRAVASCLGSHTAVLMRGHGVTIVGRSLREAVFRAIYTEMNARLLNDALRLGPVTALSAAEAKSATDTIATQIDRAWNLWVQQIETRIA